MRWGRRAVRAGAQEAVGCSHVAGKGPVTRWNSCVLAAAEWLPSAGCSGRGCLRVADVCGSDASSGLRQATMPEVGHSREGGPGWDARHYPSLRGAAIGTSCANKFNVDSM